MIVIINIFLIIIPSTNNLFARWSQNNGMFILSRITAFNITQWWIRMNNSIVTQVFECPLKIKSIKHN
jgi:hypothetical protein